MEHKSINNTNICTKHFINYYEELTFNNTAQRVVYSAVNEFFIQPNQLLKRYIYMHFFFINFTLADWTPEQLITSRYVLEDLICINKSWRAIKGYPLGGGRTHANHKQSKKNKILANYRLNQFYLMFGYKKRNIYPTLIICEYTNRLWKLNWYYEWLQAYIFLLRLVKTKSFYIPIDPVKLSKNFTNGYIRVGKAAKLGKSKKITKVGTIGLPIFFTRWLYYDSTPIEFPYKIWISDSDRKKMGKKRKKNKKK